MFGDTLLIMTVIEVLAKKSGWNYSEAMDKFYNSKVCKDISDKKTSLYTYKPIDIIELLDNEQEKQCLYN